MNKNLKCISTMLGFFALNFAFSNLLHGVEISETQHEGREQFLIRTEVITWFYDRAGGGFSRLIDRDGRDWINFSKNPLKEFPASAASGYRGLPNLVFGSGNPDAGAGHPGFDQCISTQVDDHTIRTVSRSGEWHWVWEFHEDHATFTMEKTDPDHRWWFLYEGPIAGSFSPSTKFWATDTAGVSTRIPHIKDQLFGQWKWVYFGDRRTPRVLYLVQHQPDSLDDTLWFMGSSDQGAHTAPDGMMVFGFGRGKGTAPQFNTSGVSISVGMLPMVPNATGIPVSKSEHLNLGRSIESKINPTDYSSTPEDTGIQFWYGPQQRFGHLGKPQRWINVLGAVLSPGALKKLEFQLDDHSSQPLSWGTDLHRLALPGDFNVELPFDEISTGLHHLLVLATYKNGDQIQKRMTFEKVGGGPWPQPYSIDFSKVEKLQDVVQVVDGHWELTDSGVRTQQRWYDRVLTMGDQSWKNYDARIQLTLHDVTPSQRNAPTYNVSHFGVALRWQGHTADGRQPSRRWFPLGAQGEFLIRNNLDNNQWRILHNGGAEWKPAYGKQRHSVDFGKPFWVRAQVTDTEDSQTLYRFKQWNEGEPEPSEWSVEGKEPSKTDLDSGALCIVPHNSDVTIHSVEIRALD